MSGDSREKIDEIANDLGEIKTTAEEVADDPEMQGSEKALRHLTSALEKAVDAADELEDEDQRD